MKTPIRYACFLQRYRGRYGIKTETEIIEFLQDYDFKTHQFMHNSFFGRTKNIEHDLYLAVKRLTGLETWYRLVPASKVYFDVPVY